jgi:dihydroorotase/N-acyl-D-amino-acid deacylase
MVADSVSEALEIGRRSGAPVHVSHHKAAGRENWGRTAETLDMIRRERERGQDVTVDVYPYTAGSTLLFALLPPWAQDGGIAAMLERLSDRRVRERIAADLAAPSRSWENLVRAGGWDAIQISTCPGRPEVEGSFVHQLADASGKEPLDYVCDLLIEQRAQLTMILHMMDERDVRRVIGFDASMIGSDGIPLPGKPHPRWAGTFARVLGRYAGPAGPLTLPRAIRKMTLDSANRFKLDDRGVVREGAAADLVVFDPGKVLARATYADPLLAPAGIRHVLVNGRLAVHGGSFLGQRHGRVLSPR